MKLKRDLKPRKTKKTILYEPHNLKNSENLPKRYATFKKILEYLESNNITLKEYVEHNPFQTKPYQIPKSFEFLSAVKFKNYQFIREALKYSDKYLFCFDYYGQTCYHWAAKLGNIDLLAMLIDNGKHHNQKDFEGRTPLYLAAVNNDRAICEMLMRHRANVHLKDNKGLSAADVAGSKELKYYLGDFLSQPYSNPSHKQRIANLLREKNNSVIKAKNECKIINDELNKINEEIEQNKMEEKILVDYAEEFDANYEKTLSINDENNEDNFENNYIKYEQQHMQQQNNHNHNNTNKNGGYINEMNRKRKEIENLNKIKESKRKRKNKGRRK